MFIHNQTILRPSFLTFFLFMDSAKEGKVAFRIIIENWFCMYFEIIYRQLAGNHISFFRFIHWLLQSRKRCPIIMKIWYYFETIYSNFGDNNIKNQETTLMNVLCMVYMVCMVSKSALDLGAIKKKINLKRGLKHQRMPLNILKVLF